MDDPKEEMVHEEVVYKRYYPRDINKHRPANKFFRSTSLQLHFTEHGSPLAKRAKVTNDSFLSLPLHTSECMAHKKISGESSISCLSPAEEKEEHSDFSDTETTITTARVSTTGSLNSLSDGRTPWPIPWLEAVFLPEYHNKSPVSEKHFQIIGTIARGAFGKVHRVCLKAQPSAIFAMKVQNKSDVISNDAIRQMKDEVSIHESLSQSAFIAHLYASWQSRTKLFTVLQYATGYGDLYELCRDKGPFNEELVCIYAAEIATALDFIHCHAIIYRDLKLENIVLDDNGHVQIVDFGLSKWLEVGDRTKTICGTLQYMAPEVATGNGYDHAVDYWSLGVLIYVLLTGSYPFPPASDHWTLNFQYQYPQTSEDFSPALKDLLSQLLCLEPSERLQQFGSLQDMAFFDEIDFNAISNKETHPFDYISGMRHCNSCNTLADTDADNEEINFSGFQEQYEPFNQPGYFEDRMAFQFNQPGYFEDRMT